MSEHGTIGSYTNDGCRCPLCRRAKAYYQRGVRQGDPRTVDATETRHHIGRLVACGHTLEAIAAAAGLNRTTLNLIESGRSRRIKRKSADRILAIMLERPIYGHRVPRHLAVQLLDEASRRGVDGDVFLETAGISPLSWYTGRYLERVSWETFRRLAVVYLLLSRRGQVPARPELEVVLRAS